MRGRTCAGTWVRGTGKDGAPCEVYLYQVADNQRTMRDWARRRSSGRRPSIRWWPLELLAGGAWSGAGVLGPEAFDARPFLELLPDYSAPWGLREQQPVP